MIDKFLEEQVAIFKRSVYGFIINPSEPGSFQLVYKHPANSVRQEGVGVTNKSYLFRKKEFKDVDSLLNFFKLSAQNEVKQRQKAKPVVPQQRGYNSRPF
jgi:SH2 domain